MAVITRITCKIGSSVRSLSALGWLLAINIGVFLILRLFAAMNIFTGDRSVENFALSLVELPGDFRLFLRKPWTIVTYMFSQFDMFHFVFNVLWLYWFGKLFTECRSQNRLIQLYISGGIAGATTFMISANLLPGIPTTAFLIGSSASVLSIVCATAITMPDREIGLMFFGGVKLKWIALLLVVFDMINIGFDNAGGHIAHLGGAFTGILMGLYMKKVAYRRAIAFRDADLPDNDQIDVILDKIRRSGYSSLTRLERQKLFQLSQKIK